MLTLVRANPPNLMPAKFSGCTVIQLLLLRSEERPELRQWIESKRYLSSDIVNEIIGIMAHHILREILIEIRQSLKYSLIADEATDVSNKEQLCVTIRWVDDAFITL